MKRLRWYILLWATAGIGSCGMLAAALWLAGRLSG